MEEKTHQSEVSMQNGISTSFQKPSKSHMAIWYIAGVVICLVLVLLLLLAFNKSQPVYNPPTSVTQSQPTVTPTPSVTESQAVDEIEIEDVSESIEDLQNDAAQL